MPDRPRQASRTQDAEILSSAVTTAPPTQIAGAQTLDQQRAKHAWKSVADVESLKDEQRKKYGQQAKKLPVRILNSGLGHAVAFLNAKGYAPELVNHLTDWIRKRLSINSNATLTELIIDRDATFLRRMTEEALAYMVWIIRFADAKGWTKGAEGDANT